MLARVSAEERWKESAAGAHDSAQRGGEATLAAETGAKRNFEHDRRDLLIPISSCTAFGIPSISHVSKAYPYAPATSDLGQHVYLTESGQRFQVLLDNIDVLIYFFKKTTFSEAGLKICPHCFVTQIKCCFSIIYSLIIVSGVKISCAKCIVTHPQVAQEGLDYGPPPKNNKPLSACTPSWVAVAKGRTFLHCLKRAGLPQEASKCWTDLALHWMLSS